MILTTAQWAALGGLAPDLTKFVARAWIILRGTPDTTIEITSRVASFGKLALGAWNEAEGARTEQEYPIHQVVARNNDAYFAEGSPSSVWGGTPPSQWLLRLSVVETVTDGTPRTLVDNTYSITEAQHVGYQTTITAVHPLRRGYNTLWEQADRHKVDLNEHIPEV